MGWPELSAARDGGTIATLHLASQMVGKAAVALLPWRNHGWHLTLHLHPRGLRSEPLYGAGPPFELGLDLVGGAIVLAEAAGEQRVPLRPAAVADLYGEMLDMLAVSGRTVPLHPVP